MRPGEGFHQPKAPPMILTLKSSRRPQPARFGFGWTGSDGRDRRAADGLRGSHGRRARISRRGGGSGGGARAGTRRGARPGAGAWFSGGGGGGAAGRPAGQSLSQQSDPE